MPRIRCYRASDEAVHRDTQTGQTVAERILTAVG